MLKSAGSYRSRNRGGASGGGSMSSAVPSCVFDVDATQILSYPGTGQVWSNLVAAPADGSAQTAYDFNLGSSSSPGTDDPTFVGTAGSSSAYFSTDGTDLFTLAGANTPLLRDLHKTTGASNFWLAVAWRPADESAARRIFGTMTATNQNGFNITAGTTEVLSFVQGNGTTQATRNTATVTPGTDSVFILSRDQATGIMRYWLNTTSGTNAAALAYGTTTTDAAATLRLFVSCITGTRVYAASMGNANIDDVAASSIFSVYNTRHGRTYA